MPTQTACVADRVDLAAEVEDAEPFDVGGNPGVG
jgi:hypothetical protein